jgi:hypothetical protein
MKSRPFWHSKWVVVGWLGSVVLVALSIFTPVEFAPLPLENVPRWGLYALAFPACGLLQTRWPRGHLLWQMLPWLSWGPLLGVLFFWLPTTVAQTPAKPWSDILAPVTWVVARPQEWRTTHILFRRGRQLVVQQQYVAWNQPLPRVPARGTWRTALVTPLLPGVQWAVPLSGLGSLDASWQAQEPTASTAFARLMLRQVQLQWSSDSVLHRRLHAQLPTLTAQWRQERSKRGRSRE